MLLCLFILSSLFLTAFAGHSNVKRHNALAQRKRGDVTLYRRGQSFTGARATWYQTGLGGCGIWNNPDDYIVALNFPMFGYVYPGPMCFKKITIEYQGKTAEAQITDSCEICPGDGGIDMSEGLFRHFADPAGGVIAVNWWFSGDGPDPAPKPTTKWEAPTPKWTPPAPTPTTHHTTHTTYTTTSTTSTHTTQTSAAWSSSTHHSSSSASSSAAPAIATPVGANNIANLYQAFLGLGNVAAAGASN